MTDETTIAATPSDEPGREIPVLHVIPVRHVNTLETPLVELRDKARALDMALLGYQTAVDPDVEDETIIALRALADDVLTGARDALKQFDSLTGEKP